MQFPGSMTCKLYLHGLHVAFPETLTCLPPLFSPRFGPQNQFLLCWPAALKRVFSKLPTQIPSENSPKRGKSCRSSPNLGLSRNIYAARVYNYYLSLFPSASSPQSEVVKPPGLLLTVANFVDLFPTTMKGYTPREA